MNRKITAIKVQKNSNQRVNVYLDGEFALGLSRIVASSLRLGQELSKEKMQILVDQDTREKAYQRAIRFLNYRNRSESEMRQYLLKLEIPEDISQETILRLRNSDLLNDQRFAIDWVENRSEFHPRSKRVLWIELRRKGISEECIHQALAMINEDVLALNTARKYVARLQGFDWQTFRLKMVNLLTRRGFSYETALRTINQVWAENNPEAKKFNSSINEVQL